MSSLPEPPRREESNPGFSMMLISLIIGLGLFTYLFSEFGDDNPNKNNFGIKTSDYSEITLTRDNSGMYRATGTINGHTVEYLVDTGASSVALPEPIANKIGLSKGYSYTTSTANGSTTAYHTRIEKLTLGSLTFHNINAGIIPNYKSNEVLLGMAVLKNIDMSQKGKTLTLRQNIGK